VDKNEHVDYWLQSALRDWEVTNDLVKAGRYIYALFFAHLVVEKLLKAHWVKEHEDNFPPRLHNLSALHDQLSTSLPPDLKEELPIVTSWNIEARYQDYKDQFFKLCNLEYTTKKLKIVEEMIKCLTKTLQ
jgi:HEPN domain-containing protein